LTEAHRTFRADERLDLLTGGLLADGPVDDREPFARVAAAVRHSASAQHLADPNLARELAKLAKIQAMEEAERKMAAERARVAEATEAENRAKREARKRKKLFKGKAKRAQQAQPPEAYEAVDAPFVLPEPELPTTRRSLDFDVMAYGDDGFGHERFDDADSEDEPVPVDTGA
jgi:hypothetical protein